MADKITTFDDFDSPATVPVKPVATAAPVKPAPVADQLAAIKLEREQLELESLREIVAKQRSAKEELRNAAESRRRSFEQTARDENALHAACAHRKGGKNMQGFFHGSDANFSIHHHQYPSGQVWLNCTRCGKEWKPGDPDYAQTMNLPTDNEQSSSVLFGLPLGK